MSYCMHVLYIYVEIETRISREFWKVNRLNSISKIFYLLLSLANVSSSRIAYSNEFYKAEVLTLLSDLP